MSMEQETIIYVEENDKEEAKVLTQGLMNKDVRSRAYINALGAELGLKYLALENINNSRTYNLHNVHKILEEFDISDIMLSNIHIDVRVVFDENQIFIPKSHFEYEILPDIYLVFVLAEDSSHVKFLGFFEPKLINKNNQNSDYYFIEKEKLSSPLNLKEYIDGFRGNTTQSLSDEVNDNAQTLMVSVVDQNASKAEVKELLKYLTKSSYLRDRFIEFENFEILSYKAERCPDITVPEQTAQEDVIDATADDLKDSLNVAEIAGEGLEIAAQTAIETTGMVAEAAAGAAAINGAAIAGEAATDLAAEVVEDIAEDVTDMFNSNPEPLEVSSETEKIDLVPVEENLISDSVEENVVENQSAPEELNETKALPQTAPETVAEPEPLAQSKSEPAVEEAEHGFVEGNADDFFNELGLEEMSESNGDNLTFENNETSGSEVVISEEPEFTDAVDFDSMDQSSLPQPDDMPSEDEIEILDISDVDAVPNNYDENMSETVEFNNIELSNEPPCQNELNGEETVPMLNMSDFSPLEPLPEMDNYKAESYDMDSLKITDNISMPKMNVPESQETVEAVDMESLNIAPPASAESAPAQSKEESLDIPSGLDEIPDFNSGGLIEEPLSMEPEITEEAINKEAVNISQDAPEIPDLPSMDDLQNLTVNDIVEAPSDVVEEVPVADMDSLAPVDELEGVEAASAEIPSIDEAMEADFNGVSEVSDFKEEAAQEQTETAEVIPEISEEVPIEPVEESLDQQEVYEESSGEVQDEVSEEQTEEAVGESDGDLTMLFSEGSDEVPEDFDSLDDLSQIPTIQHYERPKLPVKMVATAAVVALLVICGVAGLTMKNKHAASEPEPLAQAAPEELDQQAPIADNADILANTPEVQTLPAAQKEPVNVKKETQEVKSTVSQKPLNPTGTYMSVSKLSWEVPDYLSYSANMKKYLQTAGKSIKLSLSSDLLLVTEYAYSNQMKVDLKLSNDGALKNSQIVKSSGSKQIDKIVLQTVKDTLNVIKPATGEVPTPEFRLALIINF